MMGHPITTVSRVSHFPHSWVFPRAGSSTDMRCEIRIVYLVDPCIVLGLEGSTPLAVRRLLNLTWDRLATTHADVCYVIIVPNIGKERLPR